MTFTLTIECDNDAFCDAEGKPEYGPEVARLLRVAADKVDRSGANFGRLVDSNGNSVGSFSMDND